MSSSSFPYGDDYWTTSSNSYDQYYDAQVLLEQQPYSYSYSDHQYSSHDQYSNNNNNNNNCINNINTSSISQQQQQQQSLMSSSPAPKKHQAAVKRRSRASKKTPTTLVTADMSNFRSLVHQFTGCPSTALLTSSHSKGPVNINFADDSNNIIEDEDNYYNNNNNSRSSSSSITNYIIPFGSGRDDEEYDHYCSNQQQLQFDHQYSMISSSQYDSSLGYQQQQRHYNDYM